MASPCSRYLLRMPSRPRGLAALSLGLACAVAPSTTFANVAASHYDGQTFAPIQPKDETHARVDREVLTFDVAGELDRARVTAEYMLENPTDEALSTDAAFAYVDGGSKEKEPRATLSLDGAPLAFRLVEDADLDPSSAKAMRAAWSKFDGSYKRLAWFVFHLDLAAREKKKLVVAYDQLADVDLAERANTTYRFDYLLSPAKHWASFGSLEVVVRVPKDTKLTTAAPTSRDGDATTMRFDGLPEGELTFTVMSTRGLWLGIDAHEPYWVMVLGAMAGAELLTARLVGKLFARVASPFRRAAGAALVAAIASTAAGTLLLFGLAALPAPEHPLGVGYDPLFGWFVTTLVLAVASPVVALRTIARLQRERAAKLAIAER